MQNQLRLFGKTLRKVHLKFQHELYFPIRKSIHILLVHRSQGELVPKEDEVIWVDPLSISCHMKPEGKRQLRMKTGFDGGALVGGDWDERHTDPVAFTSREPFKSCHDRWIRGMEWSETDLYRSYVEKLRTGQPSRFGSLSELSWRYRKLDDIFHEVRRQKRMSIRSEDLVTISMGRDGQLIWGPDGRHRVCIAICAGLEKMPARVGFVHIKAREAFQMLRS